MDGQVSQAETMSSSREPEQSTYHSVNHSHNNSFNYSQGSTSNQGALKKYYSKPGNYANEGEQKREKEWEREREKEWEKEKEREKERQRQYYNVSMSIILNLGATYP